MNVFEQGAGVLISDEIAASSNPAGHAKDLVANLVREGFRYACMQMIPQNEVASALLRDACSASGKIAFTTWEQNRAPSDQIATVTRWRSEGHLANVEDPYEDIKWTNSNLDSLVSVTRGHCGVIATEGAWGRDKAKAARWYNRGFFGMFEAIEVENPNATILAMADLANVLGWAREHRGFAIYLNQGYLAKEYSDEISETQGRWAIFRYGDIDATDWSEFKKWPKVQVALPVPGLGVMEGHLAIIEIYKQVNLRQVAIGNPPLGPNAALTNAFASSRAAVQAKWSSTIGAKFADLRKATKVE